MTDITDQDRRAARSWAKNWQGDLDADISAAARVILATVDAPEPTLTERLREQFYDPEPTDEQHGIILDAAKMEHDLAEARAEVERERDLGVALAHERDDARAEVTEWKRRTDHARAAFKALEEA